MKVGLICPPAFPPSLPPSLPAPHRVHHRLLNLVVHTPQSIEALGVVLDLGHGQVLKEGGREGGEGGWGCESRCREVGRYGCHVDGCDELDTMVKEAERSEEGREGGREGGLTLLRIICSRAAGFRAVSMA